MPIAFIFSLLFSLLVVVFALQNSAIVSINFLNVEYNISQALVILISAIFGAIIVLLLSMVKQLKSNMIIRNLTKKVNTFEEKERLLKEKEEAEHKKRLEEENKLLKEREEQGRKEKLEQEELLLKEKEKEEKENLEILEERNRLLMEKEEEAHEERLEENKPS